MTVTSPIYIYKVQAALHIASLQEKCDISKELSKIRSHLILFTRLVSNVDVIILKEDT